MNIPRTFIKAIIAASQPKDEKKKIKAASQPNEEKKKSKAASLPKVEKKESKAASLPKDEKKESKDSSESKAGKYYSMNRNPRGKLVVFNIEKFEKSPERKGSSKDRDALKILFQKFGFETDLGYDNVTDEQLLTHLEALSKIDHSTYDCLVVCILSHGNSDGEIVCRNEKTVQVPTITAYFDGENCESLRAKPKLFFIQACRGLKGQEEVKARPDNAPGVKESDSVFTLPTVADFLIGYSTVRFYASYRSPDEGSDYIQTLCKNLENNPKKRHLLDILTDVNSDISDEIMKTNREGKKKQMPCFESSLTKRVVLSSL